MINKKTKQLAEAIFQNDLKTAQDLLARGANLHKAIDDLQALSRAAVYGYTDMVRLLIDNGADVNHKDQSGSAALIRASYKSQIETVRLLIDKGADLEIKSSTGSTALIASSQNDNNTDIVRFLIDNGADIDARDDRGETALYKAAGFGNKNVVRLLIDMGADPEIENDGGHTAADTRFSGVAEMVKEAIVLHKNHARETAVVSIAAAAEKKRHDAVVSKQQFLKARAPRLQLKAGP